MNQIFEGLYVGNQEDEPDQDMFCIHAAKNPFHCDAVGYKGNLDKSHENYLMLERPGNLYLNLIDPPFKLAGEYTDPIFKRAILFIAEAIVDDKEVLVRCNKGLSRSPSIIMAFMAKSGMITNESFKKSKAEFTKDFYPEYEPGQGISLYLEENWKILTN